MSEHLTIEAVDDVAGDLEVGRTVEVLLEDDRVVVARLTQIQEGPLECRADDCFRRFDSKRARATHIGKFHPELRQRECAGCGELFDPPSTHRQQKYCSQDCYFDDKSARETLVCENCGSTFDVKAAHADDRLHCSKDCQYESMQGPCDDNTREERTCPECGDTFETYPSVDTKHCSKDCAAASRWETRTCPMCRVDFDVRKTRDKEYCSRPCYYEARRNDERPDGYYQLVAELTDERDDLEDVLARARAHLAPGLDDVPVRLLAVLVDDQTSDYEQAVDRAFVQLDAQHSKPELERLLLEAVAADPALPDHVDAATLEDAIDAATVYEASERLRVQRSRADAVLNRLGVRDQFTSADQLVEELAADGGERDV